MTAYIQGEYVYLTGFAFAALIALWYVTIAIGPAMLKRKNINAAIRRRLRDISSER